MAKRIRVFLATYQLKQVDVANAIGMSKAAFSKRVNGSQAMDLDEIEKLAQAVGVQPGVFLNGEAPRPVGTDPDDGGRSLPTDSNRGPSLYKARGGDDTVVPLFRAPAPVSVPVRPAA